MADQTDAGETVSAGKMSNAWCGGGGGAGLPPSLSCL